MSKNKNRSMKYPDGTRVQTRDNYLFGSSYYDKNHPSPNDLYRKTYVVDSNKNDELVLVKETTHRGKTNKQIETRYVYYKDNLGNPITIDNVRFKARKKRSLSKKDTSNLKKQVFRSNRYSLRNRRNIRKFVKKR